ncbi:hypothetical protein P692DRAFT_20851636 [Suillus brevipes Sb2]|nr:hypothetical protein P692DRAFT_20851636 [Suillus brevipes Sb2]
MKNQIHRYHRRRLRAVNAPYRQPLRHERDAVPVHRQSFPKPGESYVCLNSVVSTRGLDAYPIHRQSFEEILPSLTQCLQEEASSRRQRLGNSKLLFARSLSMNPDDSQQQSLQHRGLNISPVCPQTMTPLASHSRALSSISTSRSPSPRVIPESIASADHPEPQPHFTVVPSECLGDQARPSSPVNGLALDRSQVATTTSRCNVRRVEHKIRGLNQVMRWFDSCGCEMLLSPLPCEALECGDLYIHQSLSTPTTRQMWIWSAQRCWEVVKEHHVHPTLPMHRLWLGVTGEPRWVTQKTISTYKGRLKITVLKHLIDSERVIIWLMPMSPKCQGIGAGSLSE